MDKKKKIRLGILLGGKSAEHEASLQSAKNVIGAINQESYELTLLGITKEGKWLLLDKENFLLNADDPRNIRLKEEKAESIALTAQSAGEIISLSSRKTLSHIDVAFPLLHGSFGEDGSMQGLLKLAGIPFVGAGVLGSAVGMDKDIMKRLLREAGIPVGKFLSFRKGEKIDFQRVCSELGLPFFVKPANLGSSVGISKVNKEADFEKALKGAFQYDLKILIEEFIDGRELECSVLGNQEPKASTVGEVRPLQEFYSYEAKYIDEKGAELEVPAKISDESRTEIQELAIKTFKTLSCEGLGRVDFFLKKDGTLLVNEINTIPGFTKISMYPRLWEASGVSYPELINRLVELALERFKEERNLKSSRDS